MPRAKSSVELKLLHGDGPSKVARGGTANLGTPAAREPTPPSTLTVTQRAVWNEVTGELRHMGSLFAADRQQLILLVQNIDLSQRLAAELGGQPSLTYRTESGDPRAHPLLIAYNRTSLTVQAICKVFGLNPHARMLLSGANPAGGETPADELDQLYG